MELVLYVKKVGSGSDLAKKFQIRPDLDSQHYFLKFVLNLLCPFFSVGPIKIRSLPPNSSQGEFLNFFLLSMNCIQHCFICRFLRFHCVVEDAGIEPSGLLLPRHWQSDAKFLSPFTSEGFAKISIFSKKNGTVAGSYVDVPNSH
jgi:hypothetical protein